MKKLIRSASLTNYAQIAAGAGLDPQRMLLEFGLPPSSLAEPEMKLPADSVRGLLEASAERSAVEAFGLLMAESRRLSHMGPLGLLVREQPSMRHALEILARYANRINDVLFLTIEDSGEVIVLREEIIVGGSGSIRQSTELVIGIAFRGLQALLGKDWRPRRVCFAHAAPRDLAVHHRVFGRIAEFNHDFNGIVFARRDLEIPNPNADPVLARYALSLLEAALSGREGGMAGEIREVIVTLLASGSCTIDAAARQLGTTRRTIHRRLAAEEKTFSSIMDEVRRELAGRYVADKHRPLAEVAALLGFSAPSGFARWHKRHFKEPASHRRELKPTAKRRIKETQ